MQVRRRSPIRWSVSIISFALLVQLISTQGFTQVRDPTLRTNDTIVVTFHPRMTRAVMEGGFQFIDTLMVRYAFAPLPEPPDHERMLLRLGIGTDYAVSETLIVAVGTVLYYRYYRLSGENSVSERYSCSYVGPCDRQIVVQDRSFTVWDTSSCIMCPQCMPHFLNVRPLLRNVRVRYEVNLRPAWHQVAAGDTLRDRTGTYHIGNRDSVMSSGVYINGTPTGCWEPWGVALRGDTSRMMYDDATHGDLVAGDSIFSRIILASPESLGVGSKGQVGQLFKFSIAGGDNECDFGLAHEENVNDSGAEYTIAEQWGSNDPIFYHCWDYGDHRPLTCVTAVREQPKRSVRMELYQCYPNPFNPRTVVSYQLSVASYVRLLLYDVLGREVAVLVDERKVAGGYEVKFDARGLSSGVYFYRLQARPLDSAIGRDSKGGAGDFVQTRKLLLMR